MLNKVPVFYIPHHPAHPNAATATPELNIKEFPNQNFLTFWKPVSSLELDIWHRWLHAHRIHILLNNDHPLPKVSLRGFFDRFDVKFDLKCLDRFETAYTCFDFSSVTSKQVGDFFKFL